jgi:ketosteroid isomerase-like protein
MASANLELARRVCAEWERGDYTSYDWADPEIEFVLADGPDPGRWHGPAGMAEGWGTRLRAWEDFRQEAEEYLELDDSRVLVIFRHSGRGKASGVELAQISHRSAGLFEIRDGAVTRFAAYFDHRRALRDSGLAPDTGADIISGTPE